MHIYVGLQNHEQEADIYDNDKHTTTEIYSTYMAHIHM